MLVLDLWQEMIDQQDVLRYLFVFCAIDVVGLLLCGGDAAAAAAADVLGVCSSRSPRTFPPLILVIQHVGHCFDRN